MSIHRALLKPLLAVVFLCFAGLAPAKDYAPSSEEAATIDRLTKAYFHAVDTGDDAASFAMLTPSMQAKSTREGWLSEAAATRRTAGVITNRASVKVTWYLDPADAQGPGLYVAVDYRGNYARENLLTGYVIWYRAPGASEFRLLRVEDNYIPKGALPALAAGATPIEEGATPLPESNSNVIGYKTVADARAALTARKDVQIKTTTAGWLIVHVPSENTTWSFTPPAHPAYPAVVKRTFFFESKGSVQLQTNALCQASKDSCDQLIRDFQRLNDQMKKAIRDEHGHS